MIRVLMNGCFGIMSSETQEEIAKTKDICVVAGVAPRLKDVEKPFPVYTSLDDVQEDYDVLMDFSVAAACPDICKAAVEKNKILITGTSGRTEEHEQMLREAAKKIPVFVCYNMNIGLLCFLELVRESMRYYMDWDIELIDQHHSKKLDAPAGITHHLMNIVKEARAVNDIDTEFIFDKTTLNRKRLPSDVGVSTLRSGSMVGEQTISMGSENEYVVIRHTLLNRHGATAGAINITRWMQDKPVGYYSPNDIIDEMKRLPLTLEEKAEMQAKAGK